MKTLAAETLVAGVEAADRTWLGRAITLLESTKEADQELAQSVLSALMPRTGNALRVAVTGAPGVGKSTFIEALGLHLAEQGHRVAVLAIDPSSTRTGGSILGDKSRMSKLAAHAHAFVRPSPSSGMLGGVTQATRYALLLCEAAGYDVILIETVGTGQSEITARWIADTVLLLVLPGGGDELQGIKRGIMESADVIAITKADCDENQASAAAGAYRRALGLYPSGWWHPKVHVCSSTTGTGIKTVWSTLKAWEREARRLGHFTTQRSAQVRMNILDQARTRLMTDFTSNQCIADRIDSLHAEVLSGARSEHSAAQALLDTYKGDSVGARSVRTER